MFFLNKKEVFSGEQEKNSLSCKDGIEKSVPHDHHLSSDGKPPNANR